MWRDVVTGWRRLIGCLKLRVIFRKRATNYRVLLRKITYQDKASYASSPPCSLIHGALEMCVLVCMFECVGDREREREIEKRTERERERMCVYDRDTCVNV